MKNIAVIIILSSLMINAFGQNEDSTKHFNNALELTVGKLYSPYRYFRNYDAFESINISYTHDFSENIGLSFTQGYGRMFDENTNSRAFVIPTNINVYARIFKIKDFNVRLSLGTGVEQIHIKCLYDFYPIDSHFYGIPARLESAFIYDINKKFSIIFNAVAKYSFLFNNENSLFADKYYYQTWFLSTSVGMSYRF